MTKDMIIAINFITKRGEKTAHILKNHNKFYFKIFWNEVCMCKLEMIVDTRPESILKITYSTE